MNFAPFAYLNKETILPSISFIGTTSDTAGRTTYTFTSVNLGGAGLCVIGIHSENANVRTISSVSIGGVTASEAAQITSVDNDTATISGLFYRSQSSSSANVVVNFSSAVSRCFISVYRILDNTSNVPNQIRTSTAPSGTGLTLSFTGLSNNSVGVAAYTAGTDGITSITWTNATSRYNLSAGGGTTRITGADFITTNSGDRAVSVSSTNSVQPITMAGAVWI
jgi:hypothetical protein